MNKNLQRFILITTIVGFFQTSFSQNTTVTGKVTDEQGEGVPGVTIIIKGTNNGTLTDLEGNYTLSASETDTLQFNFVGFKTVIEQVGTRSIIDVNMEAEVSELDEVVVIGYGTQQKKILTGAIESVSAKEIAATPIVSADQALQGRTAGVQVLNQSGQPGEKASVRIRGIGTNGNSDPLYLVDGMSVLSIDNINPSDIQSIEVLKDAASASIYGARAANGVVLITTKGGSKSGKTAITYTGYVGVQNATQKVNLLNANQYVRVMNQAGARSLMGHFLILSKYLPTILIGKKNFL